MADVERKAEAEAAKKGLSGQAERNYVGGVFNRIKQAHNRATTPGKGKRMLNRAARREARKDAMEQIRYHQAQIAGIREGYHQRVQMDEPRERPQRPSVAKKSKFERMQARAHPNAAEIAREVAARNPQNAPAVPPAPVPAAKQRRPGGYYPPADKPVPISGPDLDHFNPYKRVTLPELRSYYRPEDLPRLLDDSTLKNLNGLAGDIEAKNGRKFTGRRSREALKAWILANMDAAPAPAPAPAARPASGEEALVPIRRDLPEIPRDPFASPNPPRLVAGYGRSQLARALRGYSVDDLKRTAALYEAHNPGNKPRNNGNREALIAYITQQFDREPTWSPDTSVDPAVNRALAESARLHTPRGMDAPAAMARPAEQAPAPTPPAEKAPKAPKAPTLPQRAKLVPIKEIPGYRLDVSRSLDPYFIREYYGDAQLPTALDIQTPANLREAIEVVEEHTGRKFSGSRSKRNMIAWIRANMDAPPAPAAI